MPFHYFWVWNGFEAGERKWRLLKAATFDLKDKEFPNDDDDLLQQFRFRNSRL